MDILTEIIEQLEFRWQKRAVISRERGASHVEKFADGKNDAENSSTHTGLIRKKNNHQSREEELIRSSGERKNKEKNKGRERKEEGGDEWLLGREKDG